MHLLLLLLSRALKSQESDVFAELFFLCILKFGGQKHTIFCPMERIRFIHQTKQVVKRYIE